ncbi:hypothetical protein RD110_26065 [Rhodoferax koreense]|uniref:Lipoprotein SmpA/OmlA domain-containing protein n=1 Tax=Rhodoferax koreensis TaxID=1842727 RepID=A0A1P8K4Q5_9BURK|nr:hypothetical protein [Rhodoferax koreense]APW40978.1 hypothetical protein RD110_26065 [Rhodoferax koreense]
MRRLALPLIALLLTALAGCAVKPGMTRDEVVSQWGRPTAELDRGGVHRLQYSHEPMGQSVVMVDLDATGRVVQSREVMNLNEFSKIDISGTTTRDDILWAFGPPAKVDGVASWKGDIWSYRWKDTQDMWFWVYFDPSGVVRRTQQGLELPLFPNIR